MVFSFGIMLSPTASNAIFCSNNLDVFPSHVGRINKQFVWRVHQQRVIAPEYNKINVNKELLNVKYNCASVPAMLDLADVVSGIASLCMD